MKPETQSSNRPVRSTRPSGQSPVVEHLQKTGKPLTLQNYLDAAYLDQDTSKLSAEELAEMPRQLQDEYRKLHPIKLPTQ